MMDVEGAESTGGATTEFFRERVRSLRVVIVPELGLCSGGRTGAREGDGDAIREVRVLERRRYSSRDARVETDPTCGTRTELVGGEEREMREMQFPVSTCPPDISLPRQLEVPRRSALYSRCDYVQDSNAKKLQQNGPSLTTLKSCTGSPNHVVTPVQSRELILLILEILSATNLTLPGVKTLQSSSERESGRGEILEHASRNTIHSS